MNQELLKKYIEQCVEKDNQMVGPTEDCNHCQGTGKEKDGTECPVCRGRGYVWKTFRENGKVWKNGCDKCRGKGYIYKLERDGNDWKSVGYLCSCRKEPIELEEVHNPESW